MKNAVAFDTETHRIRPGVLAPPMVCLSFARDGEKGVIHRNDPACRREFERILDSDPIFGLNVAYDMGVCMNEWPDLIPAVFQAYHESRVIDVGLQQRIVDISQGMMWLWDSRKGYSLAGLEKRLLKRDRSDQKYDEDAWRLRYSELDNVPVRLWDKEAYDYALEDAEGALEIAKIQVERWLPLLRNVPAQTRANLALHLLSCWGIMVDRERVHRLKDAAERAYVEAQQTLIREGLVSAGGSKRSGGDGRKEGQRKIRAVQERMLRVCQEHGLTPMLTDTGYKLYEQRVEDLGERKSYDLVFEREELVKYIAVDAQSCNESGDDTLKLYGRYVQLQGIMNTHVPDLLKGVDTPIQARFNTIVDSGRTSCSKGKGGDLNGFQLQNPKRDLDYLPVGIRDCFVAREGFYFADNDFSGLELCTVAQVCIEVVGYSRLAEVINAGKDPHLVMAANIMGISYEEAVARKHEKEVKYYRQLAKVANFGFPGGLGITGFKGFARGYGVKLNDDQIKALKQDWLDTYPEFRDYFRWVRDKLELPNNELVNAMREFEIDPDKLEKLTVKIPQGTFTQLYVGRYRGRCRFTVGCNTLFQGLGADGAKEALWEVSRRCYDPSLSSVLYGARPVNFVHDEIVAEVFEEIAHEQAVEMAKVMEDACNIYLPNVPVKCPPTLTKHWMKEAEPVYDLNGRLQPYDLAKKGKWKVFYGDGHQVQWKEAA